MSRLPRKEVACPRGRPTSKELPTILQFPATPAAPPEPLLKLHGYYVVNGAPIHVVGERWKVEDSGCSLSPVTPDPFNEGIVITSRMETELAGVTIRPVSYEEYRDLVVAQGGSRLSKIQ